MCSATQELANFGLMKLGLSPDTSTSDDWDKAAAELKKQKPLVRKYYDQSYIDALGNGEVWLTQAWSGDVFQKNLSDGTNFKFVIPDEGGTLWTDNMTIPITAKAPIDAITLIDFFYKPEIAASLANFINYVCPVPGAQAIMVADANKLSGKDKTAALDVAKSPLVFPTEDVYAKLHYYVSFSNVD